MASASGREGLSTIWGPLLDPANPLPEYPRPQFERAEWLSLNGPWDCAIRPASDPDPAREPEPAACDGSIVVPFAPETGLSGLNRALRPDEVLWYRRNVEVPPAWSGRRVRLHFEAVDYEAAVFVDGRLAATHRGGYLPFSVDLPAGTGASFRLALAVRDPSDAGLQQRGKQVLKPGGIMYAGTSGIWQTVWMEPLPEGNALLGLRGTVGADPAEARLCVSAERDAEVRVAVALPDGGTATLRGRTGAALRLPLAAPRFWSPRDPYLYACRVELLGADGAAIDSASSYFALRTVSVGRSPGAAPDSRPVILLNGEPVFVHAPLDQGYWPESGMTPPADEALLFDIESMRALGFNGLRKHVKIESRRFYWHADRLGMLVIQDAVSGGRNLAGRLGDLGTGLAMLLGATVRDDAAPMRFAAGRGDPENRAEFERELAGMIRLLDPHPSIIMWTVFNESWGQFDSARLEAMTRELDPTRTVDAVSGWFDRGGGDFRSRHTYFSRLRKPARKDPRSYFISEYGGYNLAVPGHVHDESRRFGYRFFKTGAELQAGYARLVREQLLPLAERGLAAAVYTQVSDVEIETNGFHTYDRKVLKMDAALVRALNDELYAAFARAVGGTGERTVG